MFDRHRDLWFGVELTMWCVASADVESVKPTVKYEDRSKVVLVFLGGPGRNRPGPEMSNPNSSHLSLQSLLPSLGYLNPRHSPLDHQ